MENAQQEAAAQFENIESLLAALEVDFYRLEELQETANDTPEDMTDADREELTELKTAAMGFSNDDDVLNAIREEPLSIEVRSGWHGAGDELTPEEFSILLMTGGPAVRIRGDLDRNGEPDRAWLEYQDWGTPWTQHGIGNDSDTLCRFAAFFQFI